MSQLTVILPVYNASLFLAKSIKSILNQSFKDFTLLIINDGSTDGSLQIAKSFMSKDSRVKIVSHENRGLVSALNEGIELSQTEYIARMDADDIACRNRLKKQLAFMQQNPEVAFCGTAASMFYSSFPLIRKRVVYPAQNEQLKLSLLFRCPFIHPSVIIRRDFFVNNNLRYDNSFKGMEDYELWSRAVRSGECANLKNILLKYRLHAKSVTQQSNSDMQKSEERLNRYRRLLTSYFSYLQIPVTENEMNVHLSIVLAGIIKFDSVTRKVQDEWLIKLKEYIKEKRLFSENVINSVFKSQYTKLNRQALRLFIRKFI